MINIHFKITTTLNYKNQYYENKKKHKQKKLIQFIPYL